jgi:hypothetical protein
MTFFSSKNFDNDVQFRLHQHLQALDDEIAFAERLRLNPPRARRALTSVPSYIITSLWKRFYSYRNLKGAPLGPADIGLESARQPKKG